MLQSFWEFNRQNIRKLVDMAMGTLATYAFFKTEWGLIGLAGLGIVGNYVWFYLDNRNKATVAGLEESPMPGTNVVAAELSKVLADTKKA